jgi:hypothetical protein
MHGLGREKDSFRLRNLSHAMSKAAFMEETCPVVAEDAVMLPVQNVGSLQQKWSKKVQPLILIFKFIVATKRK